MGAERDKRHCDMRGLETHPRVAQGRKGSGAVVALPGIPINRHVDPSSARSSSAASLLKYSSFVGHRGYGVRAWAMIVLYAIDFTAILVYDVITFFYGDFGLRKKT